MKRKCVLLISDIVSVAKDDPEEEQKDFSRQFPNPVNVQNPEGRLPSPAQLQSLSNELTSDPPTQQYRKSLSRITEASTLNLNPDANLKYNSSNLQPFGLQLVKRSAGLPFTLQPSSHSNSQEGMKHSYTNILPIYASNLIQKGQLQASIPDNQAILHGLLQQPQPLPRVLQHLQLQQDHVSSPLKNILHRPQQQYQLQQQQLQHQHQHQHQPQLQSQIVQEHPHHHLQLQVLQRHHHQNQQFQVFQQQPYDHQHQHMELQVLQRHHQHQHLQLQQHQHQQSQPQQQHLHLHLSQEVQQQQQSQHQSQEVQQQQLHQFQQHQPQQLHQQYLLQHQSQVLQQQMHPHPFQRQAIQDVNQTLDQLKQYQYQPFRQQQLLFHHFPGHTSEGAKPTAPYPFSLRKLSGEKLPRIPPVATTHSDVNNGTSQRVKPHPALAEGPMIRRNSCMRCRKLKKKCDKENQCANCRKFALSCVYLPRKQRRKGEKRRRRQKKSPQLEMGFVPSY